MYEGEALCFCHRYGAHGGKRRAANGGVSVNFARPRCCQISDCFKLLFNLWLQVLHYQEKRPTQEEIMAAVEKGDKTAGVFGNLF